MPLSSFVIAGFQLCLETALEVCSVMTTSWVWHVAIPVLVLFQGLVWNIFGLRLEGLLPMHWELGVGAHVL